jgi:hypothetical protein
MLQHEFYGAVAQSAVPVVEKKFGTGPSGHLSESIACSSALRKETFVARKLPLDTEWRTL